MDHFSPMSPLLTDAIPAGPEWGHQLKWDGYRIIAWVNNGEVELYTKNMLNINHSFPYIVHALAKLKGTYILDGEVVILDSDTGRPNFQKLQQRGKKKDEVQYIIFDILQHGTEDLRGFAFRDRHMRLQQLAAGWEQPLFVTDLFENGDALWEWVQVNKWEGVVSKRLTSTYKSRKDHHDWYKCKVIIILNVEIVGILMKEGRISSLVMRQDGLYKGRNSSGLNEHIKKQLAQLAAEKTYDTYFAILPDGLVGEIVRWLNTPLHAEVSAAEVTESGTLRHPRIISLTI